MNQLVMPDGWNMIIPTDESKFCVGHLDVENYDWIEKPELYSQTKFREKVFQIQFVSVLVSIRSNAL